MFLILPVVLFIEILHLDGQLLSSGLPTQLGEFGRGTCMVGGTKRVADLAVKVSVNCLFLNSMFHLGSSVFALTVGCSLYQLQGSNFYLRGLQNHPFLFINQGPHQITGI